MGMSYSAGYADVFGLEKIKSLCPDTFNKLRDEIEIAGERYEEVWERLGYWAQTEQLEELGGDLACTLDNNIESESDEAFEQRCEEYAALIISAYQELQKDFEKVTRVNGVGLQLSIGYHNSEDGGKYDDIDGVYFYVENAYVLSPAGEKFKEDIERSLYVVYC